MASTENKQAGYIGKRRARGTRSRVRVADRIARTFITIGGIGTIISVSGVCLFLMWMVLPLFTSESLEAPRSLEVDAASSEAIHLATDEYLSIGWSISNAGELTSFRLGTGEVLAKQSLFDDGREPTCWSFSRDTGHVAFGFADGSVQLGQAKFQTTFVPDEEIPGELKSLAIGEVESFREGIIEVTREEQFRHQQLVLKLEDPVEVKDGVAIDLIDLSVSTNGQIFAVLTSDAELRIARVTKKKNLFTGKVTTRLREGTLALNMPPDAGLPSHLLLAGLGDSVMLVWDDGNLMRYDTRNTRQPVFAETTDLTPGSASVSAISFLVGKTSLAVGDSNGGVSVWFRVKPEDSTTVDGSELVEAHRLQAGTSPVTSLASSTLTRLIAAGFDDGQVQLYQITSVQKLAASGTAESERVDAISISPKDDAIVGLSSSGVSIWSIDAPHPETTMKSIFMPVWYEGYESPEHVWQSSSGDDAFEPKLGLIPLVYGTIKATVYSMLFGAPLAILAAIYTAELLKPKTRARIKPTIEVMASLPSVVLGFLAALVIAPVIEDYVPETLSSFFTIPFAYLLGAYLWQLFPTRVALRLDASPIKLLALLVTFPIGIWLAFCTGPLVEDWLFAGDCKAWLDGQIGSGVGGWMILLLPLSGLATAIAIGLNVTAWMRGMTGLSRFQFAVLDLLKYVVGFAVAVALAWGVSTMLTNAGWDPRGTFIGTYVQRNALVVGFIMGFAIIPIIYTLSDDALSTVPQSLRAASLGAGATQWQTAIRVVIPTAMSGLFSAVMIGLGRAVGETMIVLMAAGNTPVLEMNMFNGFRTLSANIAVEMPEAVVGSTHYRMLFLAALVLFALTFALNTVAELVRQRFRKRAFQL